MIEIALFSQDVGKRDASSRNSMKKIVVVYLQQSSAADHCQLRTTKRPADGATSPRSDSVQPWAGHDIRIALVPGHYNIAATRVLDAIGLRNRCKFAPKQPTSGDNLAYNRRSLPVHRLCGHQFTRSPMHCTLAEQTSLPISHALTRQGQRASIESNWFPMSFRS